MLSIEILMEHCCGLIFQSTQVQKCNFKCLAKDWELIQVFYLIL